MGIKILYLCTTMSTVKIGSKCLTIADVLTNECTF